MVEAWISEEKAEASSSPKLTSHILCLVSADWASKMKDVSQKARNGLNVFACYGNEREAGGVFI